MYAYPASQSRRLHRLVRTSSARSQARLTAAVVEALEHRRLLSIVTFAPPISYPIGGESFALAVAQLTGDGHQDIVTANSNGTVSVLLGNGDGTFKLAQTFSDGLSSNSSAGANDNLAVVDLGNGHPDIVVTNQTSDAVSVLLGNGDGSFAAPTPLVAANTDSIVDGIAVGDLGNGHPDLVTRNGDGSVSVLLGNGDGSFKSPQFYDSGTTIKSITLAAINDNGHTDIVLGGGSAILLPGNGDGTFGSAETIAAAGSLVKRVAVANLNGHADLIVLDTGKTVDEVLGNGDGTFQTAVKVATTGVGDLNAFLVADFNGDGIPDLITGSSRGPLTVLLGNGNGTFQTPLPVFSISDVDANGVVAADVNGDGSASFINGYDNSQKIEVRRNLTPSALRITSAAEATFTVGDPGTFTLTTVNDSSGTLQVTGLPNDIGLNFHDNGNGTAVLDGTPTSGAGGTYNLVFTADNNNVSVTKNFTLKVDEKPIFTGASSATFDVGTVGTSGTFNVGTAYPVASITATGLPSGVKIISTGNNTAVLVGDPAGPGRIYDVSLKAANSTGVGTETFVLTVDQPLHITSDNEQTFKVGKAQTFDVIATGFPAPSFSQTGLPGTIGLTFSNSTGALAGTPTVGSGGVYMVTITAADEGTEPAVHQTFTLKIDEAPTFGGTTTATFTAGTTGTSGVITAGTALPLASFSAKGLPSGVNIITISNNTAVIVGTPRAESGKTYAVVLTASNSIGAVHEDFTLTVDQAPAFLLPNQKFTFKEGVAKTFAVATTGFPAVTITDEHDTLGTGLLFNNSTGSLEGTPAAKGTFTLVLDATNGITSTGNTTFTVIVD